MRDLDEAVALRLKRRHRKEKRLQWYGRLALVVTSMALLLLIVAMLSRASGALTQTEIRLVVHYDMPQSNISDVSEQQASQWVQTALRERFADVTGRADMRELLALFSRAARTQLVDELKHHPQLANQRREIWLLASDEVDMLKQGVMDRTLPESDRRLSDRQIGWLDAFAASGDVRAAFNTRFFTEGDSREAELAGILGALVGSIFTMIVCLLVSFPIAVMAAVYLEEFAPQNKLTDVIEVNINNLAAVPSIIFGLLGLALYLQLLGVPRASALAGGMTLALMILPVIIISTRASLRSVPNSIRDAARGLGASPVQVVLHHTLPLAMPGIMTGTILGIARAIGETAPLLMIGMVAFIADIPQGFTDPAAVLPVQIFLWADSPEAAFVERTALCILVLLAIMILMNLTAIWIRRKFERRW